MRISIDLDGIACYYRIHGARRGTRRARATSSSSARCRERRRCSRQHGLHVTWFVVGQRRRIARRRARPASRRSRTPATSSATTPGRTPTSSRGSTRARVADEIARCERVLRELIGRTVRGFRAPGYDVSPAMLDVLARLGYRYDSSVFPAPGYYAAKAAVMAALALLGRPSGAVMTNPRALARAGRAVSPGDDGAVAPRPGAARRAADRGDAVAAGACDRHVAARRAGVAARAARRGDGAARSSSTSSCTASTSPTPSWTAFPASWSSASPICACRSTEKLERFERLIESVKARWEIVTLGEMAQRRATARVTGNGERERQQEQERQQERERERDRDG